MTGLGRIITRRKIGTVYRSVRKGSTITREESSLITTRCHVEVHPSRPPLHKELSRTSFILSSDLLHLKFRKSVLHHPSHRLLPSSLLPTRHHIDPLLGHRYTGHRYTGGLCRILRNGGVFLRDLQDEVRNHRRHRHTLHAATPRNGRVLSPNPPCRWW